jgi:hypothetical protein
MLQVVRDFVAIFGVIAGFSYYVLTVRNAQRNQEQQLETRQAQLYMGLINTMRSPEFSRQLHIARAAEWKDYDDYSERYSQENTPEVLTAFTSVFAFFDSVGTLVKKKLIDISLVDGLLANSIIITWKRCESLVKGDREYFQRPNLWEDFEYIYKELTKREHPELKT